MKGVGPVLACWLASAAADISADEAKCILKDKKITFFGDSISRYCYFGFNSFLDTGKLRKKEFDDAEGFGKGSSDYDTFDFWTKWGRYGENGKCCENHRQHFTKEFSDFETEYYFIQNAWFDEDETDGAKSLEDLADEIDSNIIVYNTGWWHLKDRDGLKNEEDMYCGDKWDSDCEKDYKKRIGEVIDNLFSKADQAIFRSTSCCGEDGDGWISSIEKQNDVAKSLMEDAGVPFVDVYPLYGKNDLDDVTFDGRHATVKMCHTWNMMILEAIDAAMGTGCTGASATPEPTYAPTYSPTYNPTRLPTRRPTPRPTSQPEVCENSASWHKKGSPSRNCDWVSANLPRRCVVGGEDGSWAYQGCPAACSTCIDEDCPGDSSQWHLPSGETKGCSYIGEAAQQRCKRVGVDGTYAFQACPWACGACAYEGCEDDATWTKVGNPADDCAWVAKASGSRCKYTNEDGTYAWQACRAACATCAVGEIVCADSTSFAKSSSPDKDCSWVAQQPETRCMVKDDEAVYAYEACRRACEAC